MEQVFDQRYRQRIERQIRIVKPDATSEDVDDIIDSDQSNQVFTQSVIRGVWKRGVEIWFLWIGGLD